MEQIYPGIWKVTLGEPEQATPVRLRHKAPLEGGLARLASVAECPLPEEAICGEATKRGYELSLPLSEQEQVFGFGLQLLSFNQRGKKKTLRVNSDPIADLGDSHAPVPFYVTTAGYGVLVDTARYATFYCGSEYPLTARQRGEAASSDISTNLETLYATRTAGKAEEMLVEIPVARGVDIFIFAGPSLCEAVQRYNLYSGGGCLPPRWGLGNWYRCRGDFDQGQVLEMAATFRREGVPCDVLGLEPGWQSHTYSCTFVWSDKFPDPQGMMTDLSAQGFRTNLWTHAFTHPDSPLYEPLLPYAGDYEVWQGLVPDLTIPQARQIMADFFEQKHVAPGAGGYKLDECDNSDFISTPWSFPELAQFPSGLDGEQYHSLLGMNFQEMIDSIFRGRDTRAYHEVRNAHALAAPYPFVLYSDLYKHRDFLRGVVNCGFNGQLWCPEVRHALSAEDLIRRLQTVALSPQSLINAWYIKNAPWKQWVTEENNADRFAEDWPVVEEICRELLQLRMQLIPYLYAMFYRYYTEGLPPFRALVMDYPDDAETWKIDDQFLVGDRLLVAPVIAGESGRDVYLPAGGWQDFWTGEHLDGGWHIALTVPLERIPIFVKAGALLPMASPTLHTDDPDSFTLTVRVYGDGSLPITLIEDGGLTYAYEDSQLNRLTLTWDAVAGDGNTERSGNADVPQYTVREWLQM